MTLAATTARNVIINGSMKKPMTKYWKSIEELHGDSTESSEHAKHSKLNPAEEMFSDEMIKASSSRRDFLKMCGFSVTAATLAASCEAPIKKAIPFIIKPEDVTPGVANHYASTFFDGNDYCSVLVKTRDGRPIKIEGNELSGISKGGTSARVQASILSLYDSERLEGPLSHKQKATWKEVNSEITANLQAIASKEGKIVLLTSTVISPTTRHAINAFVEKYPTTEVVYYDSISYSAMLIANQNCFNQQIIPSYNFNKANIIVSFGADFLGTWLSPIEFTNQYAENRKVGKDKKTMSRHIQLESGMSLTGSNADQRIPIKPSQEGAILVNLYNKIAESVGALTYSVPEPPVDITPLAGELLANKGQSLVVSGTNDVAIQIVVNAINALLDNYGNTLDLNTPMYLKQGLDDGMATLVEEMNKGKVKGLILHNVNPAYDYREADKFISGLKNVELSISFSDRLDETSSCTEYVCPESHYLECWNDAESKKGYFSLAQPTIPKLFNTYSLQECLLKWAGIDVKCYDFLKTYWEKYIFPLQSESANFKEFWNKSLQNGIFELVTEQTAQPEFNQETIKSAVSDLTSGKVPGKGFELLLYQSIGIGNGNQANNPWLQELPDPISKVCWDNYAAIPPSYASENNLQNGYKIQINDDFEIPVLIQPGQAEGTISIALGYGRTNAGKVANKVGVNVFPLVDLKNGISCYNINGVKISVTENTSYKLALTQTHHSMEGRDIIRETSLAEYLKNPASGNEKHKKLEEEEVRIYPDQQFPAHHWAMAIDMNACTGCGNCIIACQAENNIAVVGKEQVQRRRIMHWMRVDRYYSDDAESPQVLHQPVMCQHCDNAPCENVCPVSATMHSNEGLNQMAYNRCIGTRYCMNNCPYRVRRFNWFEFANNEQFDFNMNDDLGKMVLNPDVVVRSRGVVEKCSFCVQRIQENKLKAKLENRQLVDGEIQTACAQSCPAKAIVFGDLNDKESKISQLFESERNYHLIEEVHTLPSIGYLTKVRNKNVNNKS